MRREESKAMDVRLAPRWRFGKVVFGGVLIVSIGPWRIMRVVED